MPMSYVNGTPGTVVIPAPVKKLGDGGGGKSRPSEGKMYPRGKP